MKKIITIIFILISYAASKGQVCSSLNIRGPLSICSTPLTASYHVLNSSSSGTWSVLPSTAGTIVSSGINSTVTWTSTGGALVYTNATCSDTIFMQDCCTDLPTVDKFVKDLSTITTPNLTTFASIIGGTYSAGIITVSNKTICLQGELNMEQSVKIIFNSCTLYMGPGAVFYGSDVEFSGGSVQGNCKMWQGFRLRNHGTFHATGTTFRDAEFCISIFDQELALQITDCTFERNFVSIYSAPLATGNVFSYYANPALTSFIKHNIFSGSQAITMNSYHGQSGIPLGQKPFAGMLFNDLKAVNSASLSLAFGTDPIAGSYNTFTNLNFGIYAINSYLDIYNCKFIDCQPVSAYTSTVLYNGAAIYSKVPIGAVAKFVKVGNQNTSSAYYKNSFTNCRRGVVTNNGVSSTILFNDFVHPSVATTVSGTDIELIDADNQGILIDHNNFNDQHIVIASYPLGQYASNGIVISSLTQTRKVLKITNNNFENNRYGIYIVNSKGAIYQDPNFIISTNYFNESITPAQLASGGIGLIGIALNLVSKGYVYNNVFYRGFALSTEPANFRNLVLGMNVSSSTEVSIATNQFTNFGTAMRYITTCNGSTMKCNEMISNVQGVSLANASMTSQGTSGQSWENIWAGFPTPTSTTYNRVDGTCPPFDWYNLGGPNTTTYSNIKSLEPVNSTYIYAHPYTPTVGCAQTPIPFGDGTLDKISRIVKDNVEYVTYPEESRYLDMEFAFNTLREDTTLLDSIIDFRDFYDQLGVTNFGKFEEADNDYQNGNFDDALYQLNLVADPNVIEYNKMFTRNIGINQKKNNSDALTEDQINELTTIAWTNPWVGGNGVFTARHLLGEQVIDFENNLRIRNPNKTAIAKANISLYPNPASESITIFYDNNSLATMSIRLCDLMGRIVLSKKLESNTVDIQAIPNGIYELSFYDGESVISSMKITVLH